MAIWFSVTAIDKRLSKEITGIQTNGKTPQNRSIRQNYFTSHFGAD
jgi:hypothetical protein